MGCPIACASRTGPGTDSRADPSGSRGRAPSSHATWVCLTPGARRAPLLGASDRLGRPLTRACASSGAVPRGGGATSSGVWPAGGTDASLGSADRGDHPTAAGPRPPLPTAPLAQPKGGRYDVAEEGQAALDVGMRAPVDKDLAAHELVAVPNLADDDVASTNG
jgi:hypothetical protein